MSTIFQVLAAPNRVEILRLIREQELPAGEIADYFDVTRPAISQHLRVLADAGLITERRAGTRRLYRMRPEGLEALREFLEEFWNTQLSGLREGAEQASRRADE